MQTIKIIDGQLWMPVFIKNQTEDTGSFLCQNACHAKQCGSDCAELPCQFKGEKDEHECIWVKIPNELPQ